MVISVSTHFCFILQATESGQSEEPKVVTMRAISVTDLSKTPSELQEKSIKNSELELDPFNEDEVNIT